MGQNIINPVLKSQGDIVRINRNIQFNRQQVSNVLDDFSAQSEMKLKPESMMIHETNTFNTLGDTSAPTKGSRKLINRRERLF